MGYSVVDINSDYTMGILLRKDGVGLIGEEPTLEVRRLLDGLYLDFAAGTPPYWKASGGQRELVIPPVSFCDGLYEWVFQHGDLDYNNPGEYEAVYRNTGPNATVATEIVKFEIPDDISKGKGHKFDFPDSPNYSAGDGFAWEYIVDDDGVTIIWKRKVSYKDVGGIIKPLLENMPYNIPNNKPIITGPWLRVL